MTVERGALKRIRVEPRGGKLGFPHWEPRNEVTQATSRGGVAGAHGCLKNIKMRFDSAPRQMIESPEVEKQRAKRALETEGV